MHINMHNDTHRYDSNSKQHKKTGQHFARPSLISKNNSANTGFILLVMNNLNIFIPKSFLSVRKEVLLLLENTNILNPT